MTATRRERARRTAAAAVLTAMTSLALVACQGSDPEPATTPTPAPTPAETQSPASSASPSPTTWPPAELEATPRAAPVDDGEPAAYEAPAWLWEWVDDSWSTAIYSTVELVNDADGAPAFEGVQWLYLLAPDGAAFRIADLGNDANATIVDWDPSHAKAWLYFQGFGESWAVAEADLETGRLDAGDFTDGAGPRGTVAGGGLSQDVLPRDAAPDGTRLWSAVSPFGGVGGTVWYSPHTGTWEPSAVNDVMFDIAEERYDRGDDGPQDPGSVSGSGWVSVTDERALYMVADEGGQGADAPNYVVIDHDLAEDSLVQAGFSPPASASGCDVRGPDGDDAILACWNHDTSVADTWWVVDLDTGTATEVPVDSIQVPRHDLGSYTEDVKTTGTMPPNADAWTDVMPAPRSS
ncbi:hypothetical protein [Demequina sp. SO4-18]|uniref:hypothetical protein n=1 Tax=Demequina sp. SO4-18 TaxID=3401026 RepID=UPI003B5CD836